MGLILPQTVEVFYGSSNKEHFISKGYLGCKNNSIITVNVLDLPKKNRNLVNIICDYCGEESQIPFAKYYGSFINKYSKKVSCSKCSNVRKLEVQNISTGGNDTYKNREWLYEEYINKNRSAQNIANEIGIDQRTIRKYIDIFDLTLKYVDKSDLLTYENLKTLYEIENKTIHDISNFYHVNWYVIKDLLIEYGIVLKTRSEMSLRYLKNGGRLIQSKNARKMWSSNEFREYHKMRMQDVCGTPEARKNNSDRMRKIGFSHEFRVKMSAAQQGITVEQWNGFLTPERLRIRNKAEVKEWSRSVLKRDNFTCQCCGNRSHKGNPVWLHAHHIEGFADNPDLRLDINNGITLCNKCHDPRFKDSFHNLYGTRHNTRSQLEEYLELRKEKQTKNTELN